jgi:hypothetical protein
MGQGWDPASERRPLAVNLAQAEKGPLSALQALASSLKVLNVQGLWKLFCWELGGVLLSAHCMVALKPSPLALAAQHHWPYLISLPSPRPKPADTQQPCVLASKVARRWVA